MASDRKVFRPSDLFDATYWKTCESYWMIVDGIKVGDPTDSTVVMELRLRRG